MLNLGTNFLVNDMVFVRDVYYLAVAPHFPGLYSSLELCCEGPWFTSTQEYGCEKAAHQTYLGTERNTPVIPHWFQPCQCCCCLCSLGEPRTGKLRTQKLKSYLVRTQSLNVLSLKPGVGQYIAIHATLTASFFFLAYFYPSGPFTCIFSKTSPDFFLCRLWLTPVPV